MEQNAATEKTGISVLPPGRHLLEKALSVATCGAIYYYLDCAREKNKRCSLDKLPRYTHFRGKGALPATAFALLEHKGEKKVTAIRGICSQM